MYYKAGIIMLNDVCMYVYMAISMKAGVIVLKDVCIDV